MSINFKAIVCACMCSHTKYVKYSCCIKEKFVAWTFLCNCEMINCQVVIISYAVGKKKSINSLKIDEPVVWHTFISKPNQQPLKKGTRIFCFSVEVRYPWVSLLVLMFYVLDKKTQSHSFGHHSSCVSDELISQWRSNRPVIFRLHWGQRACAGVGRRGPLRRCCPGLRPNLKSATVKYWI